MKNNETKQRKTTPTPNRQTNIQIIKAKLERGPRMRMRNVTRSQSFLQLLKLSAIVFGFRLVMGSSNNLFIHCIVLFRFFRYFLDTFHPNTSYSSNKSQTIYCTHNSASNKTIIPENNAPKIYT